MLLLILAACQPLGSRALPTTFATPQPPLPQLQATPLPAPVAIRYGRTEAIPIRITMLLPHGEAEMNGSVSFENVNEGRIRRTVRIEEVKFRFAENVVAIPATGSETLVQDSDGAVWSITPPLWRLTGPKPEKLNERQWEGIGNLLSNDPQQRTNEGIRTCLGVPRFPGNMVRQGEVIGPKSKEELIERYADCMLALLRNGEMTMSSTERDLLANRPTELRRKIIRELQPGFARLKYFRNDNRVTGSIVEDGHEYLVIQGSISAGEDGHETLTTWSVAVFDPFTGLPRRQELGGTVLVNNQRTETRITGHLDTTRARPRIEIPPEESGRQMPDSTPLPREIVTPEPPPGRATTPGGSGSIAAVFRATAPSVVKIVGLGTGFVVRDGLIATNQHVIEGQRTVGVQYRDGRKVTGQVVSLGIPGLDIAFVRLPRGSTPPPLLVEATLPEFGSPVVVIGHPDPLEWVVNSGVLSALQRIGGHAHAIFDARISAGNSGGPLLNLDGKVIGIVHGQGRELSNIYGLNFAHTGGDLARALRRVESQARLAE
ncbi:MAG: trypsin-like peptidase domain-containing protein [Alphaproteobacteria bacterium]|nr:trypsin-like peptidase domain-containing protein [Alphaproteobacteria bacterium]